MLAGEPLRDHFALQRLISERTPGLCSVANATTSVMCLPIVGWPARCASPGSPSRWRRVYARPGPKREHEPFEAIGVQVFERAAYELEHGVARHTGVHGVERDRLRFFRA